MRIFVLGVGAAGSLLTHFLLRQGHQVSCGDRDIERARNFLGAKTSVRVLPVNARDVWSIMKAARGTAQMAALFIKHFPRDSFGVHAPESLPLEICRAILRDARARGFHMVKRVQSRAPLEL
jgi:glycerol-3-phosphate dehydrogenase